MKRYFVTDCDENGEAIAGTIFEINLEESVAATREQTQEDIRSYFDGAVPPFVFTAQDKVDWSDDLCQIVVDNFKNMELK
jgi:hypothetical protein